MSSHSSPSLAGLAAGARALCADRGAGRAKPEAESKTKREAKRKAKRRGSARLGAGEALGPDAYKRWLAARILEDPSRVMDATSHPVHGRFEIAAHRHADLLQLDVVEGCRGQAVIGDRKLAIHGTTLMMVPPGVTHGYELAVASDRAAVWLVKIRLPNNPPVCVDPSGGVDEPGLPPILTGLKQSPQLHRDLAGFIGDWTSRGVGVVALAKLVLAISRWPTAAHELEPGTQEARLPAPSQDHLPGYPPGYLPDPLPARCASAGDGPSARVRLAIQTLGQRLDDPPNMQELAAAAHMSERHFARRFRQDFGCTPHAFLSARRLDVARGMLRDRERPVSDIADALGFSSPAAFSRWFLRLAGQSPRKFRSDPHNH